MSDLRLRDLSGRLAEREGTAAACLAWQDEYDVTILTLSVRAGSRHRLHVAKPEAERVGSGVMGRHHPHEGRMDDNVPRIAANVIANVRKYFSVTAASNNNQIFIDTVVELQSKAS